MNTPAQAPDKFMLETQGQFQPDRLTLAEVLESCPVELLQALLSILRSREAATGQADHP